MKMRKLFAGIAAAATMLGGLALGVTTANAAPDTSASITVNNAQEGHTYTAYKIAEFSNVQSTASDTVASVEVNTESNWVDALKNAFTSGKVTLADEYVTNPAAALATLTASDARKVIDALVIPAAEQGAVVSNGTVTVNEGWYIVTDSVDGAVKTGATALVATVIEKDGTTYTKFTLAKENGQQNIEALGVFNAKSENVPPAPVKTVENVTTSVNDQTVSVGDQLKYTIKHTIPASAAGYDDYTYTITDKAEKGLTIDTSSTSIVVTIGNNTLTRDTDYTVTPDGALTDGTTTVIALKSAIAKQYAGQEVSVTYTATVNSDILAAANKTAENEAKITTGGGESEGSGVTVKTYGFNFTKVGVDDDANALAGAEFVVKKGEKFLAQDGDGKWSLVDDVTDAKKFTSAASTGRVSIDGLASGTYTVVETEAPDNYAQNFTVTFDVTIGADGKISFTQDALKQVTPVNNDTTTATASVKNVKSITQLPLTGAAGTALFTVIALLVAGAAATVYAKSRKTAKAMMA